MAAISIVPFFTWNHCASEVTAGQSTSRNVLKKIAQALASALIRADSRDSFRATVLA